MLISRTPFRVSFAGGGTDLPEFYRENGEGAVLSAAICQYMYIVIHPYFHDKIRIKYARTEDVASVAEIEHPIVRECLKRLEVTPGIEIASFADISSGTGLGSSSAFTVGLLHALYAYKGVAVSPARLAEEACDIEINVLQEPIGKQDQYAAAFGGLNRIVFKQDETVTVAPLNLTDSGKQEIEKQLALYFVGGSRRAKDVLCEQKTNMQNVPEVAEGLRRMRGLVEDLHSSFKENKFNKLGDILHKGWLEKQQLATTITNTTIDDLYAKALDLGASGGKLLGAGGTGFLLLCHSDHTVLQDKLGCRSVPFTIDTSGSTIILGQHGKSHS